MPSITIHRGRQQTLSFSLAGAMIDTGETVALVVGPVAHGLLQGARYFTAESDAPNGNGSQCSIASHGPPVEISAELTPADTVRLPFALVNGRHPRAAYELLVYDADSDDAPRTLEVGDVVIVPVHDA